jgi:hypothetical protein
VVRPLLATRNGIARLHARMVPAQATILERSLGVIDTKALATVAELQVADALAGGPRDPAALAAELDVDADALGRLLRFLVGRGFFARDGQGRYRNNSRSELLRADHPDSMRDWARFFGSEWHVSIWNRLEHSVRTGESAAEAALGHPFWEHLTEADPSAGAIFDAAMEATSRIQLEAIAHRYDWPATGRVCDVGGGTGTVLSGILAAHPALTGVLFDLPAVVAKAGPVLERAGVTSRVEIVGGDFFAAVPDGCDRYVLQAIVHDWDDASCIRFLGRCREALAPGGRVLVLEGTMPAHDGDHPLTRLDLEMLVDTGKGRERTRKEFDTLFASAGLRVRRAVPIALSTLFELEPA